MRSPRALKCRTAGRVPGSAETHGRADKENRDGNGVECIPIETCGRIWLDAERMLWRKGACGGSHCQGQESCQSCDDVAADAPAGSLESDYRCCDACGFWFCVWKTQTCARGARADPTVSCDFLTETQKQRQRDRDLKQNVHASMQWVKHS